MQPRDVIADFVGKHEGGYQNSLSDRGNVVIDKHGDFVPARNRFGVAIEKFDLAKRKQAIAEGGRVIGTMRGVTPDVYARYLGCPVEDIDEDNMKALSLSEAINIGLEFYYEEPRFDKLPWGPITAILLDMGWGAGPATAVKILQRRLKCKIDGAVGPEFIAAYREWIKDVAKAANDFADWKIAAYRADAASNPAQAKFLQGWINRANYFRPTNKAWWSKWKTGITVDTDKKGDLIEKRDDGKERRLDPKTSPVEKKARKGIWATIGGALAAVGATFRDVFDFLQSVPGWAFGAIAVLGAVVAILYFTGIIGRRRAEHKEWKH
jgi:lysozyme family protein